MNRLFHGLSVAAVLLLVASSTGVEAAERSARPSIARRFTNPFAIPRVSRFTVDRFGLPALASKPVLATPVALSSPTPAPQASEPALPVETTSVVESEMELEFTPLSSMTRPPFRPAVRSPFRPPPRPPF